jgi:ribosomal protein S18 acetylase RimI-like enzyme
MNPDADATAASLTRLWESLATVDLDGVWSASRPGVIAVVTGMSLPTMNGVWATGPEAAAADVRDLLDDVASRGVPFCLQARPHLRDDLSPVADDRGLVPAHDVPLMACPDPGLLDMGAVPGLVIRELPREQYDVHCEVAAAGFEAPLEMFTEVADLVLRLPGMRSYVGSVDGTPVTTAMSLPSPDGTVSIVDVATPPEHRGHGYGLAITGRAAADAFASGARETWLQSSPEGHGVYRRLGFRDLEAWPMWVGP